MAILHILNNKACFPVEVQFKNQLNQLEMMEELMHFLFSPVVLETFKGMQYQLRGEHCSHQYKNQPVKDTSASIPSLGARHYAQYQTQTTNSVRHSLVVLSLSTGAHRWHF